MIDEEIKFWTEFVKTDRFLLDWCSDIKTGELHNIVYEFILKQSPEKVLDCGSGAVSILTGTIPNDQLTVCDLLADEYGKIFDYSKYNVVKPQPIACENLPYTNEFDIVHISNALDHTQKPAVAFSKLYGAVKSGGYLIVQSFEDEGKHENWKGMHQWNLHLEAGHLTISNKFSGKWTMPKATVHYIEHVPHMHKNWFIYILKKK